MKKILILLLLIAFIAPAFADEALVLPAGVIRAYLVPVYGFSTGEYDSESEYTKFEDGDGATKFFNIGAAVEYGVTDWITAAVQWTPGYYIWSTVDKDFAMPPTYTTANDKATINGPADLFVGAKLQFIGEKGLVLNDLIRFALAPGVIIPLPSPDWQEQYDNLAAGDPFIISAPAKHAFALGARAYFDYIVSEMFYINLYSEFIYYFKTDDEWVYTPTTATEYEYGYKLTVEVEPKFEPMIGDGVRLGLGLPATFTLWPETKADGVGDGEDGYGFSVGPNVSLFLMKATVPMEFELGYTLPLMGKNAKAVHALVFQMKTYLKF